MRLVVALMLASGLVGCGSTDPYQRRAEGESVRQMARYVKTVEQRQEEQRLIEYAERWHNDQLRKQGYVVCEQRSAKVLACK